MTAGEEPRSGRSITISIPSVSGLRSRVRIPTLALGGLGRGRWRVVLLALVVLVAVADVLLLRQDSQQETRAETRAAAMRSAEQRVPVMLSYSYRTLDADLAVATGNATGEFRDQYAGVLSKVVAPNATRKKITTKAAVSGASVVSGGGDDVTVLLFITQSTTTGSGGKPSTTGSRIAVQMKQTANGWFVAGIRPV